MTEGMTHEQAREALEALALDALDASERGAVMAHVATCVICQSELAALENTVGALAYAATPIPLSTAQRDRIRARLLARAAADRASAETTATVTPLRAEPSSARSRAETGPLRPYAPARRVFGPAAWMAMAASLVAILGVGAFLEARRERDAARASLAEVQAASGTQVAALDSLRATLRTREQMIANLIGPQVAVMTLTSTMPTAPTARMFWDQQHGAWTFVAHNIPMPKAGRIYQMWLVTPTAKISAGTFMPSPGGEVMMQATYPMAKDSLAAVAVTDEPMGGSAQPTTTPMMLATR
jgi:anti-sigma factor RsiW